MKQVAGAFLLLIIVMAIVAWSSQPETLQNLGIQSNENTQREQAQEEEKIKLTLGGEEFDAFLADTPAERERGLSGRKSLGKNESMLFVFEKEDVRPSFWMKDMQFAIDIIWIDDGKVVQITENAQPAGPGTPDGQIPLFLPKESVDFALEVKAGEAEARGISVGDGVELPEF